MNPAVLSIGSFPAATMAELASRFELYHHAHVPPALDPDVAGRIRGLATEANRGAPGALIGRASCRERV